MLTVMTQNLNFYGDKHGPWSQRRDLLCNAIQESEPDVIALQAVCSEPDIEGGRDQATQISRCMPQYPYVFFYPSRVTDTGREEGCAILSRVALHEPNVRELSLRRGLEDDSPRVIQHARFDLEKGSLNVFNAYFSWVEEQAGDNIKECIAFLARADGPTLLVGDFNMPADSPLLEKLAQAGFVDLWEQANPGEKGYTFESDLPEKRIDYAWANEALARRLGTVETVRREDGSVRVSDHLGLKIDLKLRTAEHRPPPYVNQQDRQPGLRST